MPDMPTIARSHPLAVLDCAAHGGNAPFQMMELKRAGFGQWRRLANIAAGREPPLAPVIGTRVPIIVTSRADGTTTRLASCALGGLVARANLPVPGDVA